MARLDRGRAPRLGNAAWIYTGAVVCINARTQRRFAYFPVQIALADQTSSPRQPDEALVPQQKAGMPSSPAAEPAGASRSNKHPDGLEIKLHTLAKLRQPSLDTHLSERNTGLSRMSATSDDAATGSYATNAVRDFIRAQAEGR